MDALKTGRFQGFALLGLSSVMLVIFGLIGPETPGPSLCGVKALSGWPCPFCGGLRATAALGQGALGQALRWNPAATLAHAGLLVSGAVLVLGRTPPWFAPGRQRAVFRAAAVILCVNWIYLIAVGR